MLLTIKQIKKIYESLDQFPEAQYVVLESRENSSGIGPRDRKSTRLNSSHCLLG
jgi:hypothetical protein